MATQLAVPDEVQIAANDEAQTEGRDFEAEARVQGWRPQDEFTGDPEKWIEAEAFIKSGERSGGFLKKSNDALARKVAILERTVKKLTREGRDAYANAIADLKTQQKEAVESGDVAAFERLDGKLDKLREEVSDTPAGDKSDEAKSAFRAWRRENPWFDKATLASATDVEKSARVYADQIAEEFMSDGLDKQLTPAEFFAKVAEEVEQEFPALKGGARREKPASDVGGVTRPGGSRTAKTGANLPPAAKAHAERFIQIAIPGYKDLSKQAAYDLYAKSYDWS